MANKAISELPQAQNVNNQDLFVLEQGGLAKKLTAETFITEQGIIDALAEALDGHGGIQSVTLQSLSGRVRTYLITFSDGSATTFQVYDGSTITNIQKTSTAGLVDTYTVYMSDGTTTFFQVRNGQDGSATWDQINSKAPVITDTASGAIANFPDGADDMPVTSLVANIEPKQSGSGDPAPDNIRPISGWTGCNVTRTGKNLVALNVSPVKAQYLREVTVLEQTEQKLTLVSSSATYAGLRLYYHLKAGTYTASVSATASDSYEPTISIYRNSSLIVQNIKSGTPQSFTISEDLDVDIRLFATLGTAAVRTVTFSNFQIELGSTASAYEPYITPSTVSLSWQTEAGTVYGGTIDVATGLLTVGYARYKFTGTESLYAQVSSSRVAIKTGMAWKSTDTGCCSDFKFHGTAATNFIYLDTTMPAEDVKTYMANHDVYAVGELATPQTYQLTPQEVIKTLLGTNNVWADTGDTSVTYPADTKLFIEKLTMPTEDDLVANQTITSGKYFMIGNSLYLALANIASGAQITIGTNAQRVSLADALNTINS